MLPPACVRRGIFGWAMRDGAKACRAHAEIDILDARVGVRPHTPKFPAPGRGIVIPVYKKGSFTPVALSGLADCGRMTCATYRRGQI